MKWILLIAWASNGTGFTAQEFDTFEACLKAKALVEANNFRGGGIRTACFNKTSGNQ